MSVAIIGRLITQSPVAGQTGTGNLGAPSRMILSTFGDSAERSEEAHPATATRWLATKAETGGKDTCPVKSASVFED
jgi:hypothetical protein